MTTMTMTIVMMTMTKGSSVVPKHSTWLSSLMVIPVASALVFGASMWVVGNDPRAEATPDQQNPTLTSVINEVQPAGADVAGADTASPELLRTLERISDMDKRTQKILKKVRAQAQVPNQPATRQPSGQNVSTYSGSGNSSAVAGSGPNNTVSAPVPAAKPVPVPPPAPAPVVDATTGAS
jgi:hypothetical protein